jgi:hypothetical protein
LPNLRVLPFPPRCPQGAGGGLRLMQGEGADQCRVSQRGGHRHPAAGRSADEMNRSHIERCDELGEIVRVSRSTVLFPVVLPRADPMISLGIGDEPISLCDLLSDRLPNTKVGKHSMDEDDGLAGALFDVG